MLSILAGVFIATLFLLIVLNHKSIKQTIRVLYVLRNVPGPPKVNLLVGNTGHLFNSTPEEIFSSLRGWAKKYPSLYNLWIAHTSACNIYNPDDLETILSNPIHNNKSLVYDVLHQWLGTGLLTSNGAKWHSRRKILTPAFHFNILQEFLAIFNEETDNFIREIKKNNTKEHLNIEDYVTRFTLKTIAATAMGTTLKFDSSKEIDYKNSIFEITDIFTYRLFRPWTFFPVVYFFTSMSMYFKEKRLTRRLHRFTTDVIKERKLNFRESLENHDVYTRKKRYAMLDLLIAEGTINDEGIREEVDTFMFEGHDTTSSAISFSLMLLANHRDIQDQVHRELVEVLGNPKKKPSYNDLQELKLMERCIKEVLRMYPSVHFISRELGEDVMSCTGHLLPKGTLAHLQIYDIHHDPKIYPDAEKFDPDRFLPENSQGRHPFAYLPFSAGPRNCIGQKFALLEIKSLLCGVLANFVLEPVDTPESIVPTVDLILRTRDGIRVKFVPRL